MTNLRLLNTFCLLVTSLSTDLVEGTQDPCGSAMIHGPLDKNRDSNTMPMLVATTNNPPGIDNDMYVPVMCQLTATEMESYYNPRLRIYFTCDGKVCVLLSQNGSHEALRDECGGITYTYHEDRGGGVLTFTYHIAWMDRLLNSVITCGVNYHPPGVVPTTCFNDTAGLVTLNESPECSLQKPTTTEETTTSNAQTTTDEKTATTISPASSTTGQVYTTSTNTASCSTGFSTTKETTDDPYTTTTETVTVTVHVSIGGHRGNQTTDTLCVERNTSIFIGIFVGLVMVVLFMVILILILKLLKERKLSAKRTVTEGDDTVKNEGAI